MKRQVYTAGEPERCSDRTHTREPKYTRLHPAPQTPNVEFSIPCVETLEARVSPQRQVRDLRFVLDEVSRPFPGTIWTIDRSKDGAQSVAFQNTLEKYSPETVSTKLRHQRNDKSVVGRWSRRSCASALNSSAERWRCTCDPTTVSFSVTTVRFKWPIRTIVSFQRARARVSL